MASTPHIERTYVLSAMNAPGAEFFQQQSDAAYAVLEHRFRYALVHSRTHESMGWNMVVGYAIHADLPWIIFGPPERVVPPENMSSSSCIVFKSFNTIGRGAVSVVDMYDVPNMHMEANGRVKDGLRVGVYDQMLMPPVYDPEFKRYRLVIQIKQYHRYTGMIFRLL